MKTFLLIVIGVLLFSGSALYAQTQRRSSEMKKSAAAGKKKSGSRVVSFGVCNNYATDLVKPEYPPLARAARARGKVNVGVLIDKSGKVIKAKAVSGHPLLRTGAVSAALKTEFKPFKLLSGKSIKVSGVIVYDFVGGDYNWLEIGREVDTDCLIDMLPFDFAGEKRLFEQYRSAPYEEKRAVFQKLRMAVESKLGMNSKSGWLFRAGIFLKEMKAKCCRPEAVAESGAELKILLANAPSDILPGLKAKLENLVYLAENPQLNTYGPLTGNKVYEQLKDLEEKLPMLGS